jgi:uncharacterized protein (TIGR02145 family)
MRFQIYFIILRVIFAGILLIFVTGCQREADSEKETVPVVITLPVNDVNGTTARSGGKFTGDGGGPIIAKGVVWSTSRNPTIDNNEGSTSDGIGDGEFTSLLTGLSIGTTYYVRAFGMNHIGIAYGNTISMKTLDGVADTDGNFYQTVIIGDQEWLRGNLKVTRYRNGGDIHKGVALNAGAFSVYPHSEIEGLDSETEVLDVYGALYNWYAVNDDRGICPVGWRVPGEEDWQALSDYIISTTEYTEDNLGNALKACYQVGSPAGGDCTVTDHPRWDQNDEFHGLDVFGFSALPGGFRSGQTGHPFYNIGKVGCWWSATEASESQALFRAMGPYGNLAGGQGTSSIKPAGYSVRCIRE